MGWRGQSRLLDRLQGLGGVGPERPAVAGVQDLQVLGGELDVDQAARRQLQVPETRRRSFALHQPAHLQHVARRLDGVPRAPQRRLDGAGCDLRESGRARPHHPRPGQGQELPGLGRALVIAFEGLQADRNRA